MTIEEMIDTLNASVLSNRLPNGMGLRLFQCDADTIIAALLAGQLMREEQLGTPGTEAWDAATIGDFNLWEYAQSKGLKVEPSTACYRAAVDKGILYFNPNMSRSEQLKFGKPVVDAAVGEEK